jgi:cytochrome c oxidase assembly factor CtaG
MGRWLAGLHFKTIYENVVNVWLAVFMLYYVAVVVLGIVQSVRRKDLWETRAFPPLGVVHFVLFMPIAFAFHIVGQVFVYVLSIPFYLIAAGFWLWHRIVGKPKKQKGQM